MMRRHPLNDARLHRHRGQGGFALLTGLAVWLLVGGVTMLALLDMTMSATRQVKVQQESAQQVRAIEGAMDTAISLIQVDASGRRSTPTGKEDLSCEEPLGGSDSGLVVEDGMGNTVTVTATCWGPTKVDGAVRVDLSARLPGTVDRTGSAELEVVAAKGRGHNVTIRRWSIDSATSSPATTVPAPSTTTSSTTTSSTTTTSTTTTTTTTTRPPTTTTTTRPPTTTTTTRPPTTTTVVQGGVSVSTRTFSEWQSGYCVETTVRNEGRSTVEWKVQVPARGSIYTFWNGEYSRSGDLLTVVGVDWNRVLRSGDTAQFGFCSNL